MGLRNYGKWFSICTFVLMAHVVLADEPTQPVVYGVYGMESTGGEAWLAVKIPVPESSALSGLIWYNNDGSLVIPRIVVGAGYLTNPGPIEEFVAVATEVSGMSSDWSSVDFEIPVGASLGALYVAFELPADIMLTGRGAGGGPGIGYAAGNVGCRGWLSGEGEVWAQLSEEYGFAVIPQWIPWEEGMAVKSLRGGGIEVQESTAEDFEPYFSIGPNPFNPQTEIRFGLARTQKAKLDIYNLQGRRICRLIDGTVARGHHSVTWLGRDGTGRSVASGVYIARLDSEDLKLTRRMLLVR